MDFYIYHGAPKAFYARKNNAQAILSIPHRYNNKSYTILLSATLQVKVFARSPFGNQLLRFGKTFCYKSSRQLQNFRRHGDDNGRNLEDCFS